MILEDYNIAFHITHDYRDIYDFGGRRRTIGTGHIDVEITCDLITNERMKIDEFINKLLNLSDEKIEMFNSLIKICTPEILEVKLPYSNGTTSLNILYNEVIIPKINKKMERIAYENELNKYLHGRR